MILYHVDVNEYFNIILDYNWQCEDDVVNALMSSASVC